MNSILMRLALPVTTWAAAHLAQENAWGLFNHLPLPHWATFLLAILMFDCLIYAQHVLFHTVPMLWRIHRVHHADLDCDVTTGLRFHTLEILLSACIKIAAVFAIGPPPMAVLVFEVALNATSMFNHANAQLPLAVDRWVRCFLVTPDMHRVHHSIDRSETNSNFGFNLPWWDYLFGTYRAQPKAGHQNMPIGLDNLRDPTQTQPLAKMLLLPFSPFEHDHQPGKPASDNTRHPQTPHMS